MDFGGRGRRRPGEVTDCTPRRDGVLALRTRGSQQPSCFSVTTPGLTGPNMMRSTLCKCLSSLRSPGYASGVLGSRFSGGLSDIVESGGPGEACGGKEP